MKKLLSGAIAASCIFGAIAPTMNVHAATFESSVYTSAESINFNQVYEYTASKGENEDEIPARAYRFHLDTPSRIDISTSNDYYRASASLMNANHKEFSGSVNDTTSVFYVNAGDYYLVFDFSNLSKGNSTTYNFHITATSIGATYAVSQNDPTDDDRATARVIDPNSAVVGNVYEFDDQDWYQINIPSKGTFNYTFQSDYKTGSFDMSSITFYDENGNELSNMNNVTLTPGKLYICVSYAAIWGKSGTSYHLNTSFTPAAQPTTTATSTKTKKVTVPKAVLKKVKRAKNKKSMTISVKRAKGVSGYEYTYSLKKNFKRAKRVRSNKTSITIKKLNKKKKYYVRVRCYKRVVYKYYYGKYSNVKKA